MQMLLLVYLASTNLKTHHLQAISNGSVLRLELEHSQQPWLISDISLPCRIVRQAVASRFMSCSSISPFTLCYHPHASIALTGICLFYGLHTVPRVSSL